MEILIYKEIGSFGFTAQELVEALKDQTIDTPITVRINSTGGDVMDGLAIYNTLSKYSNVDIYIDGIAASMASVIAMAGNKVYIATNALLMIHKPWTASDGTAEDFRDKADLLDKVEEQLISAYVKKTGLDSSKIKSMLEKETWLDAEESLSLGFVDEIVGTSEMAASVDLSIFNSVPERLAGGFNDALTRMSEIKALVEPYESLLGNDFIASLINDNSVDTQKASGLILNALGKDTLPIHNYGTGIHMNDNQQAKNFLNDASDALLLKGGISIKNASEESRRLASNSVVSLAESFLKIHGVSNYGIDKREILNKAFGIRAFSATHTSGDFTSLLQNTAMKALRTAYEEDPCSHTIWTSEAEVPDFKTNSLVQLSEAPDLDKIAEGAEYKHGTVSDEAELFSIEKFGKIFTITYEALINDDLNAFTRLPQAFGKSARRKECDLVYSKLTGNPDLADGTSLFHADRANILTGLTSLDIPALGSARQLMRKQKGPSGLAPLNIAPRYLIVPAALETTAEQLISSIVDPSKSNDTPNIEFIKSLTLVVDSRLDVDSESTFYIAASPNQVDTIIRAYLQGAERPYIEAKQGWEVDGMGLKCRFEFAAVPADFRGLVKASL